MVMNVLWKKFAYQLVLIEIAKVAYEMHSRKAKKVKFEIHKRTGKFVVYLDDSVYKDINFKYGYTLAKELYRFVSGKKDEDIEKDMMSDIDITTKKTKEELKELRIPITTCKSLEYSHQHRSGDIFEVSIKWNSMSPNELLIKELESIKEKANCENHRVIFNPNKEDVSNDDFDVEDINLHKMVVYYESGARVKIELQETVDVPEVHKILDMFIVSKIL